MKYTCAPSFFAFINFADYSFSFSFKFSFWIIGLQKNWLKELIFTSIEVGEVYMKIYTKFGGMEFQVLGILLHFDFLQIWPNFPFKTWIIVHGGQKIKSVEKFMHVEFDVKCMQANFGGLGLSGFRNSTLFCL